MHQLLKWAVKSPNITVNLSISPFSSSVLPWAFSYSSVRIVVFSEEWFHCRDATYFIRDDPSHEVWFVRNRCSSWLLLTGYVMLHDVTFTLFVYLYLKWVSCRQHSFSYLSTLMISFFHLVYSDHSHLNDDWCRSISVMFVTVLYPLQGFFPLFSPLFLSSSVLFEHFLIPLYIFS